MQRSHASIWFVAPAVTLMIILLIAPVMVAGALSFTNYSLGNPSFDWVGLSNYEALLKFSSYKKMFNASLTYVVIVVPLSVALGLGAAVLIQSLRFGGEFYKTIFFLPVMATLLAMAIAWEFALHPIVGVINDSLRYGCDISWMYNFLTGAWYGVDPASSWYGSSCDQFFPLWLGDRQYALGTIAFIGTWQIFGFNMVLYLAGITGIPRELYAAAAVDGADSAGQHPSPLVVVAAIALLPDVLDPHRVHAEQKAAEVLDRGLFGQLSRGAAPFPQTVDPLVGLYLDDEHVARRVEGEGLDVGDLHDGS